MAKANARGVPLPQRQAEFLALLRARPRGMSMAQIAKTFAMSVHRTGDVLRSMRNAGMVASSSAGQAAVWATPDRIPAIRQAAADRRDAKLRARERRRKELEQKERELRDWLRIEQRCIPALGAQRLLINAPNSVFNLAQQ